MKMGKDDSLGERETRSEASGSEPTAKGLVQLAVMLAIATCGKISEQLKKNYSTVYY
jgi:hypothetical protein